MESRTMEKVGVATQVPGLPGHKLGQRKGENGYMEILINSLGEK